MRLNISLLPIAVVVRFERRPLILFPPRITIQSLVSLTAAFTVILGGYITRVTLPDRRQRYDAADRAVRLQITVLDRAAEVEEERERGIRERYGRNLASAAKERDEAAKWPVSSEKREHHERLAAIRALLEQQVTPVVAR